MSFSTPPPLEATYDEEEETKSACSSIEALPFAVNDEKDDWRSPTENSGPVKQPDAITIERSTGMEGSHAWSSITTDFGKKSMLSSMPNGEQPPFAASQSDISNYKEFCEPENLTEQVNYEPADSLLGSAPLVDQSLGGSSYLADSGMWNTGSRDEQTQTTPGAGSLDFSQLMKQADDRNLTPLAESRMSVLVEEEDVYNSCQSPHSTNSSNLTPQMANHGGQTWLQTLCFGSPRPSTSTVPLMPMSPSYLDERVAMDTSGRDVRARCVGENMFEVSMNIDELCSVVDVMDVVGNPDLLRLWCDPIQSLVITRSSEGARSAMNRGGAEGNREYEGEWIEATTSTLVSPSNHNNFVYSVGLALWTYFGFPSYGQIKMFVERREGRVGLTIGPFSGGLVASHTMNIQDGDGSISVVDKVRLNRDEDHFAYCCGIYDFFTKWCCMPTLAGHMDQALSSMLRLRALVEHGETGAYNPCGLEADERGVSSLPLLS